MKKLTLGALIAAVTMPAIAERVEYSAFLEQNPTLRKTLFNPRGVALCTAVNMMFLEDTPQDIVERVGSTIEVTDELVFSIDEYHYGLYLDEVETAERMIKQVSDYPFLEQYNKYKCAELNEAINKAYG